MGFPAFYSTTGITAIYAVYICSKTEYCCSDMESLKP